MDCDGAAGYTIRAAAIDAFLKRVLSPIFAAGFTRLHNSSPGTVDRYFPLILDPVFAGRRLAGPILAKAFAFDRSREHLTAVDCLIYVTFLQHLSGNAGGGGALVFAAGSDAFHPDIHPAIGVYTFVALDLFVAVFGDVQVPLHLVSANRIGRLRKPAGAIFIRRCAYS
jgi:hypothetical protein